MMGAVVAGAAIRKPRGPLHGRTGRVSVGTLVAGLAMHMLADGAGS